VAFSIDKMLPHHENWREFPMVSVRLRGWVGSATGVTAEDCSISTK
jgi:hypothetical protein